MPEPRRWEREVAPGAARPLAGCRNTSSSYPSASCTHGTSPSSLLLQPRLHGARPYSSPHTPRVSPWAQNSTCSQSPERLAWRSYASEARIPTVWSFPRAHSWGLELLCLGARTEQARAQHESSSLGEVQQNFTANPNCWIHQQCQTPGRMIPVLAGQALQPEGRSSNVPLGASAGMSS